MKKTLNYNHTIYASFIGYIVQAVINNFVPLLFLTFQSTYGISLDKITMLVTFNFGIQLLVDLVSVKFVDRIGYKTSILIAHIFAAIGLAGLTILPEIMPDPFVGLLLSVAIYAIGGGLLEVLVSPIVEACPTKRKEAAMSLLHSFYCWGHVGVVLLSTAYFTVFGIENWKYLALIWALIPLLNAVYYSRVPFASLMDEGEKGMTLKELVRTGLFWIMMLLMVCAGACEQGISQWASAFAELGLGVSKTVGDLAGPLLFAMLMGSSRAIYGKYSEKIKLEKFMAICGVLCLGSYLLASLSKSPVLGLMGCALCGLSVGILWPGTFSMAAAGIRGGGTAMFALLALAGDLGCSGGPTFVGLVSETCGENLKKGILAGAIFPVLLLIGLFLNKKNKASFEANR
ncbi:MAG: MFS transporter [Lachnospiraceae bacterium]|nr:MFS transporter [Lachnospiraceae bacterium]